MNNKMNKKNIMMLLSVLLVSLIIIGGTFAALIRTIDVTNNVINGSTTCFDIQYTDNTDQITGTLFPSSIPAGGLSGSVAMNVSSSCSINGTGTLSLNVDGATSEIFKTVVAAHCEDTATLETIKKINGVAATSSNCTGGSYTWVTTGVALKYAIYNNSSATGTPLSVGYIKPATAVANNTSYNIILYTDFNVTSVSQTYYIYIWLDGNLSDDTYANLPFGANISTSVVQDNSVTG